MHDLHAALRHGRLVVRAMVLPNLTSWNAL